jgi:prepilin signal peptidase PulO-like enzyme (type II secretory pathway)
LLIKTDWKEKTMIFKRILKPKFLLNVFFLLFGLLWGVYLIFSYFGIKTNFILLLLPLTLIIIILKDLLETHLIIVSVLLSIIRIIFDPSIFTLTFFLIFVFRYMIFIFLFGFLFNLSFFMFVFPVKIEKLKKGMLPIEAIIQKGKKCGKVIFELTPKMLKYKFLIKPKPKGLSEEDIRIIKKLYKEKKLDFDTLLVQQTLPFAPFIFIGLLITIFCHGSCIDFIKLFIFI